MDIDGSQVQCRKISEIQNASIRFLGISPVAGPDCRKLYYSPWSVVHESKLTGISWVFVENCSKQHSTKNVMW
jgi:hypothetical protein